MPLQEQQLVYFRLFPKLVCLIQMDHFIPKNYTIKCIICIMLSLSIEYFIQYIVLGTG